MMYDGDPKSYSSENEDTDTKADGSGKGRGPIVATIVLILTALVIAFGWFVGFHGMTAGARFDAPHTVVEGVDPADQTKKTYSSGHTIGLPDLQTFSQPGLKDANSYAYRSHEAAKIYYDWYMKWYNVIVVAFLMAIAAWISGEAINRAITARSAAAHSTAAPKINLGDLKNFIALLTISLSAVTALAIFVVNEHYKLVSRVHAEAWYDFLGAQAIAPERWDADSNVVRQFYSFVTVDSHHVAYFPILIVLLLAGSILPLIISKTAIEGFRLAKAVGGPDVAGEAQKAKEAVDALTAEIDQNEAALARALETEASLKTHVAALENELSDRLAVMDTATQALATTSQRYSHLKMYCQMLKEYLQDIALKKAQLTDKQNNPCLQTVSDAEIADAIAALSQCEQDLAKAVLAVEAEVKSLTIVIDGHSARSTDPRIVEIKAQIRQALQGLSTISMTIARLNSLIAIARDRAAAIQSTVSKYLGRVFRQGAIFLETWSGTEELTKEEAQIKKNTLDARYAFLFAGSALLFLFGNLVAAPDLPEFSGLSPLIVSQGHLSFATPAFFLMNVAVALASAAAGICLTVLTDYFFDADYKTGASRAGALLGAVLIGVCACWFSLRLPEPMRVSIPSLPDNLGYTALTCKAGDEVPLSPSASAYWFDRGQFISLDAGSHCALPVKDQTLTNYYIVLGTASQEGGAQHNTPLGNSRAEAMLKVVAGPTSTNTLEPRVYGINLGQHLAEPDVTKAWQLATEAKDANARINLTNEAMLASAKQRKVVVVRGYSTELADTPTTANLAKTLGAQICDGSSVNTRAFINLFNIDPSQYQLGDVCEEGALKLLDKSTLEAAVERDKTIANALKTKH